ncbi:hypothetical protein Phi19:3_gp053 [Cellulophaga phage phi19:3]|uniref:Uncharacterized protein n=1 Tax=Cellulophaga phage phi19:3 TaxID=1327971 RepID=R9ZYS9_9CAUD|nr:hypothetical protein Phi19:3_gp053 [Cellulophaga phage phi19:3]AGO47457.1 hypothetical protein Phi19:3_gp053 [Cellulophaga phage phi19:3]
MLLYMSMNFVPLATPINSEVIPLHMAKVHIIYSYRK